MSGATQLASLRFGKAIDGTAVLLTIEHRVMRAAAAQKVQQVIVKPALHALKVATQQIEKRVAASRIAEHTRPTGTVAVRHVGVAVVIPTEQPTVQPTRKPALASTVGNQATHSTAVTGSAATAAPLPTTAPDTEDVARAVDVPAGGWGQNFRDPTVLDPDALNLLRSRYHDAVAHISVDEDGHAIDVTIDGGSLGPDERADLVAHLKSMRYVPAECNGLRCAAQLEIKV